jgi:hypothetical protein
MRTPISLNTLETFGLSVKGVLQELEENFPPVNPHPDETLSQIMYRSGQRSVVEWINHRLTEDNAS